MNDPTKPIVEEPNHISTFWVMLLGTPLMGILIIWLSWNDASKNLNPWLVLIGVMAVTNVVTASMAALEISRYGQDQTSRINTLGWFLFILLVWFIGYPSYLIHRARYNLPNRGILGFMVVMIFTASWGMLFNMAQEIAPVSADTMFQQFKTQKSTMDAQK